MAPAGYPAAVPSQQRPFVIGIAGGSGSGKTSLARALFARLGGPEACIVLDHDSYYRDLSQLPPGNRGEANFDHPESLESDLLARHLAELRAGRAVARPCYDFASHTRLPTTLRVEPRPVIVCEGILLLAAPELRSSFDLRVFLDAPADVRVLRRMQRDVVERGRTLASVTQQYLDTVRPMHERFVEPARTTADLVLGWPHTPEQQAAALAAVVRERLPG